MTKTKQELNAHLFRLAIWSVVSLVAGVSLMLASSDMFLRSFGGMNLAWAIINLLICFFSWRGKTEPKLTTFREVLALNLGLNCGYMGIGGTLLALGDAGTVKSVLSAGGTNTTSDSRTNAVVGPSALVLGDSSVAPEHPPIASKKVQAITSPNGIRIETLLKQRSCLIGL